ncbi:hypothetical protein CCP3SC15_4560003 [Gammaproteobacteria bacterium]
MDTIPYLKSITCVALPQKVQMMGRTGSPVELKQPLLDPGLCIGCGLCENKCPVDDLPAIRISSVGETRSTINQMLNRR